jgi:hypothetical protein
VLGAPASGESAAPRPESSFVVLALFLGIVALVALPLAILSVRSARIDATALRAELFAEGALPDGFEPAESAALSGRRGALRLVRAADGPAGPLPQELLFVRYPSAGAARAAFQQRDPPPAGRMPEPTGKTLEAWEEDPAFAWSTVLESGEIAWRTWTAELWIERRFHQGGGWHEVARVNLSQKGRPLVLFARFPDGQAVDQEAMRRVLSSVELRAET